MKEYNINNYQVVINLNSTKDWYEKSNGWNCECAHCRNFIQLAKNKDLPIHIIEILDELGIPIDKPTYVGELYTDEKGIFYQFSYRMMGEIMSEPNETQKDIRCCHDPYPYGAPNFPEPHFDLEFYVELPWVIDDTAQ